MMVSLIESNYMGFGSGVMGGSTGIMLQNRGAYFSLDPDHPNALAPRSRTLHTLMPGMLLRDGRAEVAIGAMGGDGQPQTMVQLVQGLVDDGLDPQAAVDRPRFVARTEAAGQPLGPVSIESDGVDTATVAALEALGPRGRAGRAEDAADGLGPGDPPPAGRLVRGRRRSARRLRRGGALNAAKFTPHVRYAAFSLVKRPKLPLVHTWCEFGRFAGGIDG